MGYRRLVVLSCCAPCSCAAIKHLVEQGTEVTVFFYNPNIYPQAEYEKRRDEQARLCRQLGADFVEGPYEPSVWEKAVCGLENEPERGRRCSACFYLRLKKAQEYALANQFDALTSVLGVSRYKDLEQVNRAARRAWMTTGKAYWANDWRKNGLEELRRALIQEMNLYKQTYCGCKYSLAASQRAVYGGKNETRMD
ncbi:MAG: epoxyqueuosine reductase QueH [Elusimicrobiaceae bacterium]|nr:epoxyqueuosine reductase QueH [Elusimicrobiaceae bacterium]